MERIYNYNTLETFIRKRVLGNDQSRNSGPCAFQQVEKHYDITQRELSGEHPEKDSKPKIMMIKLQFFYLDQI